MMIKGNLRKMRTALTDGKAQYTMSFYDVLEPEEEVNMNQLVGEKINLRFTGAIHCIVSGKRIKKTYGEGMSFDAFRSSPTAVESIIRPELSRIHEGIALRDKDWEEKHHNQPHFVYLSLTSEVKVGVTRSTNIPSRWIDQGAVQAIILAETPYRQLAGLIEVDLKTQLPDKTNWRNMLKNVQDDETDLLAYKDQVIELLPEVYYDFVSDEDEITSIEYPVIEYPVKVTSIKFDKAPAISGRLMGIRGQYLIFDNGRVLNIRSHAGYEVEMEF